MKKNYIAPESKLIVVNLNENIAYSSGIDEIGGTVSILFTESFDGCRDKYTDMLGVETSGTGFLDYYEDLNRLVEKTMMYEAYWKCFKRKSLL